MSLVSVNSTEIATLLASLRYWQRVIENHGIPASLREHFDDHDPLDPKEIDELCERINFSLDPPYVLLSIDGPELIGSTVYPSRKAAEADLDPQLPDMIAVPLFYDRGPADDEEE